MGPLCLCRLLARGPPSQEPVTPPRGCLQHLAITAERLSDRGNVNLKGILLDDSPRPDAAHESIFADHLLRRLREYREDLKGTASDRDRHPARPQLASS